MYKTDKIAILLATYNGAKYIEQQLQSLLEQTNQEWTVYIHDDGSQDGTVDIITSYAQKYPEHFVKVEGQATGSAKTNFFYLMTQVEAPYVMCCDQDDIWLPDKIQLTLDNMHELENEVEGQKDVPLLVFTELKVVDNEMNTIADKMSDMQKLNCKRTQTRDLVIQNYITGCTMMINHKLLRMALGKNQESDSIIPNVNNIIMHDWWCALVAAEYGRLKFISKPTILYRQHDDNSVGAKKVSSLGYIINKLSEPQKIKESLQTTQKQANEFRKVFKLESTHLISQYGELQIRNKLLRVLFYCKNHVKKTGFGRNAGLILFG